MEPKNLAVVLFLDKNKEPDLKENLLNIGALNLSDINPVTQMIDCTWVGWSCNARMIDSMNHFIMIIYFNQSDFLDNFIEHKRDENNFAQINLIWGGVKACNILKPRTAMILTHLWQVNDEYIKEIEKMVSEMKATKLMLEYFGALFLSSKDIEENFLDDLNNRDKIKINNGTIFFAGKGQKRWN